MRLNITRSRHDAASSAMPERWKLDPSEDPSRRRMKLKRNFKYRQYRGSSDDPPPPEDGRGLQRIDSKLLAGAVNLSTSTLAGPASQLQTERISWWAITSAMYRNI